MPDNCWSIQLLYGELCYGKYSVGGQKKRFKETLNKTLTSFTIDVTNWEVCVQDRPLWHTGVRTDEKKQDQSCSEKTCCWQSETTLPPTHQPARHTHAPRVEECCRPQLDTVNQTLNQYRKQWTNNKYRT